jgi:hypothetical protein
MVISSNSKDETVGAGDGSGAKVRAAARDGRIAAVAPPRRVDFRNLRRGGSNEDKNPFGFIVPPIN